MLVCRLVGVVLLPLVELELVGAAVGADVVLLPPDAVGVAVGAAVGAVGAAVGATDVITLCGTAMAKVVVWAVEVPMSSMMLEVRVTVAEDEPVAISVESAWNDTLFCDPGAWSMPAGVEKEYCSCGVESIQPLQLTVKVVSRAYPLDGLTEQAPPAGAVFTITAREPVPVAPLSVAAHAKL